MSELIPWSTEWKRKALLDLRAEYDSCRNCGLCEGRKKVVFGQGNEDARVMLIGEAPGEEEDKVGQPFIGNSGDLLNYFIQGSGSGRDQVYVTNVVMCRPPENRDPMREEREACKQRLYREIYTVDPTVLVLIGSVALTSLGGNTYRSIEKGLGKVFHVEVPGVFFKDKKKGMLKYPAIVVYHPAYILRYDKYDDRTKKWVDNGPAHHTYLGIERAISLSDVLHEEYNA